MKRGTIFDQGIMGLSLVGYSMTLFWWGLLFSSMWGFTPISNGGLRPEYYDRYPHRFLGSQRQRIAIARVLMLKTRVLTADEPVSALEISIQAQVLNILMDLQKQMDLAQVFLSHDLSVVRRIADQIMVMYLGKVVEQGQARTIFDRPAHPYTQALLGATPAVDPRLRCERVNLTGERPSPHDPPPGYLRQVEDPPAFRPNFQWKKIITPNTTAVNRT